MEARSHNELTLQTILVPTDCAGESLEALRYALALAAEYGALVVVLHVVRLELGGEGLGIPRAQLLHDLAEAARDQLRRVVELLAHGPVPPQIVIAEGRPDVEILDQAQKRGADLIVMSAHRHAGLLRWLHPQTAAHVMREAPCPVLMVKARGRGFLCELPEGVSE